MKLLIKPPLLAAVAAASLLAGLVLAAFWKGPLGSDFALWMLLCILGEMLWLRHPVGHATLSMAIPCNFAAMLVLPPHGALVTIAVSTALVEAAWMHKHPLRVLFNASQSTLAGAAGIVAWQAVGGAPLASRPFDAAAVLAGLLAAIAYTVVNTFAVSVMIAFEHGIPPLKAWRINFGHAYEMLNNAALFSLGAVLAVLVLKIGSGAVALVAMPLALSWVSYRRVLARHDDADDVQRAA